MTAVSEQGPIYLDHAATTPLDPRVFEAMRPFFLERYGNAASRQHALGRDAAAAVERAREQVAALIGADPREIVFTSGATESNNLALKGVARAEAYARSSRSFVTARTEHHAVLDPLRTLAGEGFAVQRLAVDGDGRLDLDALREALAERPRLCSLMHVNNELGVVHPLVEIGAACREHGVLFHTDATQAAGKLPIDVDAQSVDLLSLSAHKLYGPKGIGALYVRRRRPRVRVAPLLDGGGHERGMRSGTLNVPAIVGFGAAAEIALGEMDAEARRVAALRDRLEARLLELEGASVNGGGAPRVAGITNLSFAGVDAESSLLSRLARVCASSSSACTSAALQPSHVLRALGLDAARVAGSVRLSPGRFTTPEAIEQALDELVAAIGVERTEGARDACAS